MSLKPIEFAAVALLFLSTVGCQKHAEQKHHGEQSKVVVTCPEAREVVITQQYVCQIHSRNHIEVCALESGYLEEIPVKEGQAVKRGDLLFKILPTLYQAKLDAALAELRTAQVELDQSKKLLKDKVVSPVDVALHEAALSNAQAEAQLAEAELSFTDVRARFDGIVDRMHEQVGSLVEEGDVLTTLSDNAVMWVYFNVPETRYLEYMAEHNAIPKVDDSAHAIRVTDYEVDDDNDEDDDDDDDEDEDEDEDDDHDDDDAVSRSKELQQIELVLADGSTFPHSGRISAVEAQFNNETGNIPFRADFPNPAGLLRHGQTGNVLIKRTLLGAVVIPQRATFEILDKLYVYVVDDDEVLHQRQIEIEHELEDIFVVRGLKANERIVLDGVRQVRDGEKVEYEFQEPAEALTNLKYHAE